MVDGKAVALGIPGRGANAQTAGDRIPDIPLGRPGSTTEAAGAVLLLCSKMSSYVSEIFFGETIYDWNEELISLGLMVQITGHTLEVTGGRGI